MKLNSNYKMPQHFKRVLATIDSKDERSEYKKLMISSHLSSMDKSRFSKQDEKENKQDS